jgi:hypothetical protein
VAVGRALARSQPEGRVVTGTDILWRADVEALARRLAARGRRVVLNDMPDPIEIGSCAAP